MYSAWEKNPSSVHVSWDVYFRNLNAGAPPGQAHKLPPTLHTYENQQRSGSSQQQPANVVSGGQTGKTANEEDIQNSMRILLLIRAYQVNGHLIANLDPLGCK